ncbi:MAG TPA: IS5 family transposase, partial [Rhizomicrobium sp.]|nr:IS5 family transposase [Rhizomicrobium sp.]
LRDDQWDRINGILPGREGHVGATAKDNRLFVEAVLYRYRAGIAWRDLPERFGDPIKIHTRFSRWARSGIWKKMFALLAADADNEYAMIDSTIVRAHQHSAGAQKKNGEDQAIGRSKGGLTTKIHALVDALGNPTAFFLTQGQAHDLEGSDKLLPLLQAGTLLADKAFDADERVIEPLLAAGKNPVIPPKSNRKSPRTFDKEMYKARHLIENFFCKLKQYRAIATRYDKTARNFLAGIHLAAAVTWLN